MQDHSSHFSFIGRKEILTQFEEALHASPLINGQSALHLVYGNTGAGKRTVVHKMIQVARQQKPSYELLFIDWQNELYPKSSHPTQLNLNFHWFITKFEEAITTHRWQENFSLYQEVLREQERIHQIIQRELQNVPTDIFSDYLFLMPIVQDLLPELMATGGATPETVCANVLTYCANMGIPFDDRNKMEHAFEKIIAHLHLHMHPADVDFYFDPHERKIDALAEGLREIAEIAPLLIVFNEYTNGEHFDQWVERMIKRTGIHVHWIISEQTDFVTTSHLDEDAYLRPYRKLYGDQLDTAHIRPFTEAEIALYFAKNGEQDSISSIQLEKIMEETGGIPLAVASAAQLLHAGVPITDIDTPHIEKYVQHVICDEDEQILFAFALAQGDAERLYAMVATIVDETSDVRPLCDEFVQKYEQIIGNGMRLIPSAEQLVQEKLRAPDWQEHPAIIQMNQAGMTHLESALFSLQKEIPLVEDRVQNKEWSRISCAYANHAFGIDSHLGWKWVAPRFIEAWAYAPDTANQLYEVALRWKKGWNQTELTWLDAIDPVNRDDLPFILQSANGWRKIQWLSGTNEKERLAILDLKQGQAWLQKQSLTEAWNSFALVKNSIPFGGTILRQQLGMGLEQIGIQTVQRNTPDHSAEKIFHKVTDLVPQRQRSWYELGSQQEYRGKYVRAIRSYVNGITVYPLHALSFVGWGNCNLALGNLIEAEDAYNRAKELDESEPLAYVGLGKIAYQKHEWAVAEKAFQQALHLDHRCSSAWASRALIAVKKQYLIQAQAYYEKALLTDGTYLPAYQGLAKLLYRQEGIGRAIELLETARIHAPLDPSIAIQLGDLYLENQRPEDACKLYNDARLPASADTYARKAEALISIDPEGANAWANQALIHNPYHAKANIVKGILFCKKQAYKEAVRHFERGEAFGAEKLPLTMMGTAYMAINRYELAETAFNQVMSDNPSSVDALIGKGELHRRQGEHDNALILLLEARKLDPDNPVIFESLSKIMLLRDRPDLANNLLTRAIQMRGYTSSLWATKADIQRYLNQPTEATKSYEQALQLNPSYAPALLGLAELTEQAGTKEKAKSLYKQVVEIDPTNEIAQEAVISLYKEENDHQSIVTLLQTKIEKDPENPLYYQELGDYYRSNQAYSDALEQYQMAYKLQPDHALTLLGMGYVCHETENHQEAVSFFQEADQLQIEAFPYELYAESSFAIGEFHLAETLYQRIGNQRKVAQTYIAQNEWEKAEALYANLSQTADPVDEEILFGQAESAYHLAKYDQAIGFYQQLPSTAELEEKIGLSWAKLRNWDEADRALQTADEGMDLSTDTIKKWANVAYQRKDFQLSAERYARLGDENSTQTLSFWGKSLVNLGKIEEAIPLFQQLLTESDDLFAHLELGKAYFSQEEWDSAEPHLQAAVQQAHLDGQSWAKLGKIYRELDQPSEAVHAFIHAAECNASHPYTEEEADVYFQVSGYDQAIELYESLLKEDDTNADYWLGYGKSAEQLGEFAEAAHAFTQAIEYGTEDPYPHLYLAKSTPPEEATLHIERASKLGIRTVAGWIAQAEYYQAEGMLDEAISAYHSALDLNPTLNELWIEIGKTQAQIEEKEAKAEAIANQQAEIVEPIIVEELPIEQEEIVEERVEAVEVVVESSAYRAKMIEQFKAVITENPRDLDAHVGLGYCYDEQGNFVSAEKSFQQALAINPKAPTANKGLAQTYLHQGKLADSIPFFKTAYDFLPHDQEIITGLGEAYLQMHQFHRSRLYFEKLFAENKRNVQAIYHLARIEIKQGNFKRASKLIDRFFKLQPKTIEAYLLLGDYYLETKNQSAEDAYTQAKSFDESSIPARCGLAMSLIVTHRFVSAQRELDEIRVTAWESAEWWVTYGRYYQAQAEWIEAEKCFRTALTIDPYHFEAYGQLGATYAELRNDSKAIHAYVYAYNIYPDDARVNLGLLGCYRRLGEHSLANQLSPYIRHLISQRTGKDYTLWTYYYAIEQKVDEVLKVIDYAISHDGLLRRRLRTGIEFELIKNNPTYLKGIRKYR